MNAVLYARVSTEKQADKDLSIPAQLQAMRDYARHRSWTVVEEFVEPGVSARTVDRPALQALLARCRANPKVDVVLVHKIDRLARSVYDHAAMRVQFKQRGIKLASIVENVDDSVSGQLLEHIMAAIGEFYSGNLSEEVKKGMRMKVEKGGWPFKVPRGYRIVANDDGSRQIEADDEATFVRFAYERYSTGLVSMNAMRHELASRGLLARNGRPIPVSGVERILKNPFYAGRVRWAGVEHPGKHPPLVSSNLYLRVQAMLRQRHRDCGEKGRLRFLMRGIAACANCGGKLTAERHDRWWYYRCITRSLDRNACSAGMSNGPATHEALNSLYRRLTLPNTLKAQLLQAAQEQLSARTRDVTKRTASLRMKVIKLEEREIAIAEAFADGGLSTKAYRAALLRVRTQIEATKASLRDISVDPELLVRKTQEILSVAESVYALHAQLNEERQRVLLRTVFRRIDVNRSAIVGYELRAPFDQLLWERSGPPNRAQASEAHSTQPLAVDVQKTLENIDQSALLIPSLSVNLPS